MVFIATAVMEFLNDSSRWIVLVIAIVHMFIAIPLAFFTFYKGYQGVMLGYKHFTLYKMAETFIVTVGFVVFFLSLSGYHGPLFLLGQMNAKKKSNGLIIMCIAEITVFLISFALRLFCLIRVHDYYGTDDALELE